MVDMKTKDHILNHAEHLARTRGFDAFSYADLAEAIGIRKASIHYHFATKASLATATLDRYSARFFQDLQDIRHMNGSAADDLNAYIAIYQRALSQGTQVCLCVAFSASRDSFDDATLQRLDQFHERSLAWLTDVFEKAREDGSISGLIAPSIEEAHATLALVEGAQLMSRAARSQDPFDHALTPLKRRLNSTITH